MSTPIPNCRLGRAGALAGLILGATAFMSTAFAGECPGDKVKANVREPVNTPANGVTDTVLATIDLAKEPIKAEGRLQRVRKLVVAPGGVVPWHSHDDRPALIYVIEGEINEYNSNCSVPIVHKAGDVARETLGTSHWWKARTVRLANVGPGGCLGFTRSPGPPVARARAEPQDQSLSRS